MSVTIIPKNRRTQDGDGNPIGSLINPDGTSYGLDTHNADGHIVPVNRRFANFPGTVTSTLSVAASAGATSISIQAADYAAFTDENWIYLKNGNTEETEFIQIKDKPGSPVLTLDRPLDVAYAITTTTVEEMNPDMVANGSLAVPVSYIVAPPADEVWHITRINLATILTNASASDEFLSIAALANGVVLRSFTNSIWKTWTVWKTDADIITDQFDLVPVPTVPAAGAGQRGRWWLKRADVIIRLDGATSDYAQFLIQDNLTGADLVNWSMKAQGHIEGA